MQHRSWSFAISVFVVANLLLSSLSPTHLVSANPNSAPISILNLQLEEVDPNAGRGQFSSIILDAGGVPHIAYHDYINGDLLLATKVGQIWFREEVDSADNTGGTPSLAIDRDGFAHIAYYDDTNGDLRYASQLDPDGWEYITVDSTGITGGNPALILDIFDTPHIAYWDISTHSLKYAYLNGEQWQISTVAEDLYTNSSISMALSTENLPHIAYQRSTGIQNAIGLGYAFFDGFTWMVETVVASTAAGYSSSLALNSNDEPLISYSDGVAGLKLIARSGAWGSPEVVNNSSNTGAYNKLVLDSTEKPRIIYYDNALAALLLSYKDNATWRVETLASNGSYPSLFLSYDQSLHVGYFNQSSSKLYYTKVSPFPDITVSDIWQSGSTIHYQIQNLGLGDVPAGQTVVLLVKGAKVSTGTTDQIVPAGGRIDQTFSFTFNCTLGETLSVRVDLDPGAVLAEITRSNNSRTESWRCQGVKPSITSGPNVTNITQTSATINWITDIATDSRVDFGRRLDFSSYASDSTQSTSHSVSLAGLTPGSAYSYTVTSTNIAGQSVSSKTLFFSTPPSGGAVPTGVSRSITKDEGPGDIYTLSARIPDARGNEKVEFFYQLKGSPTPQLIGTAYGGLTVEGGGAAEFQAKFNLGKSRLSRLDLNSANIITQVTIPGGSVEKFEDYFAPLSQKPPEVEIISPYPDYTVYITTPTVPADTILNISAIASAYEWDCEWTEVGELPNCGDVSIPVEKVQFFLTPGNRTLQITPDSTNIVSGDLSIADLAVGNYSLIAYAFSQGLQSAAKNVSIHIVQAEPQVNVERTIYRTGNAFTVALKILNPSPVPVVVDKLFDYIHGFQPVFDNAGDVRISSMYEPALRFNKVAVEISQGASETRTISPGGSYQASYTVIPILYEDNMQYAFGNIDVFTKVNGNTDLTILNAPAPTAVDPTSSVPIPLENSVAKALALDDYILVTHPGNLKDSYGSTAGEPNWNTLLRKMAQLAQRREGVLAYMDSQDPDALNDLLQPQDPTWTSRLHPNFVKYARGYVLIVGEPGVMPSYTVDNLTKDLITDGSVDLTDNPFAHTGGNGAPDLVVGRIPGTNIPQLIKPIDTSLQVLNGELTHDRSYAAGSIGTGDGASTFKANAADHKQNLIDDGWVVTLLDEEKLVRTSSAFNIPFDEGDLVAAGDIDNDGDQELLIGDISTDDIYKVDFTTAGYSHQKMFHFSNGLKSYHGFAIGNIDTDPQEELVMANDNDHIYIYDFVNNLDNATFSQLYAYTNEMTLANTDGDSPLEIVVAFGDTILQYNGDGSLLRQFTIPTFNGFWDIMAAGAVYDNFLPEEIVLFDYDDQRAYIYDAYGALLDSFVVNFDSQDSVLIADTDNTTADPYREEIWVTGWRSNIIRIYQSYGDQPQYVAMTQDLIDEEKLAVIRMSGESHLTPLLLLRSDETYILDANYPAYMQTRYRIAVEEADYVFYRGHGSSSGWESININLNPPLNFLHSAPMAVGLTCKSGDYGGEGNSFSEKMLWWGVGGFFGSTENSNRANNGFASDWISNHAKDDMPYARLMLLYKNKKWDDGTAIGGGGWDYWTHEYNFYGDAKFGYSGNTTSAPFNTETGWPPAASVDAAGLPAILSETNSLHVDVPPYVLTTVDGIERAIIPDGDLVTVSGELPIPYYTVVQNFPAGTRVSEVSLISRSELTTATGIHLQPYIQEIDDVTQPAAASMPAILSTPSELSWTPALDQVYSWSVSENADGSSQLKIQLNPFYYNPLTTDAQFYTSYDFNITTIAAEQKIANLSTVKEKHQLNDPVQIQADIVNLSLLPQNVLVNTILRTPAGKTVASADLIILENLAASSSSAYSTVLDTTGIPAGTYEILVELRTPDGIVIDIDTKELNLGLSSANLLLLTANPLPYKSGDTIDLALRVSVNGDLPLENASARIEIVDYTGAVLAEFTENLSSLSSGSVVEVHFSWDTTGAPYQNYTARGYVLYNSTSTRVLTAAINTLENSLYFPVITN